MAKPKSKSLRSARRASKIEHADALVATRLGKHHKHPAVTAVAAASEIADQPPLIAICVATAVAGVVFKRPALARTGFRMLAAELVATGIKHVIKRRVDRIRPHRMLAKGRYQLSHEGSNASKEGPWSSFPSGHTAGAVAVARAVARDRPRLALPVGTAAAVVSAIQIPRRAHFPSDVIVGAAVGLLSEWLISASMRVVKRNADDVEASAPSETP